MFNRQGAKDAKGSREQFGPKESGSLLCPDPDLGDLGVLAV
jgi:hypothetical protein